MTTFELIEKIWETFYNGIGEKKVSFIEEGWKCNLDKQDIDPETVPNDVFKSNIYSCFVKYVSTIKAGKHFYNLTIQEIDDEILECATLDNKSAIQHLLRLEHGIYIKDELAEEIARIVKEN